VTRFAIVAALSVAASQATFRARVDLVRLDVSVVRGSTPVRGLAARDFTIDDHGVRQRVDSVTLLDDLPVSILMTLDTSGSVAGKKLAHLIEAGKGLIAALRPGDRAALVTFSSDVRVRVPLTGDRSALESAMADLKGEGPTSLRDAVWVALQLRPADTDNSRPLVLVFTDGIDTASWLSRNAILDGVRRAGVVVHAIDLQDDQSAYGAMPPGFGWAPPRNDPQVGFLGQMVGGAGGRRWSAGASQNLREMFTRALDEMRARYLVTFYPEGVQRDGWHELKVSVNVRGTVTARPGYFVPPRS